MGGAIDLNGTLNAFNFAAVFVVSPFRNPSPCPPPPLNPPLSLQAVVDLLNPTKETEKRTHKKKRLVQVRARKREESAARAGT